MTRQAFIRVLLSLLLLVSQQMASSHVMSHLAGALDRTAAMQLQPGDDGLSAALAQDQTCSHCLAFAQLSGALGSKAQVFALPDQTSFRIAAGATQHSGARTIFAFQSRAPPSGMTALSS